MKIIYAKCGVNNYMNEDHRSYRRNFCSCGKKAAVVVLVVMMVVVAAATPAAEIIKVVVVRVYLRCIITSFVYFFFAHDPCKF